MGLSLMGMDNDGTQDPVPPPVLPDPLAGLVTGSRYEPEPLRVRVTEPPMPDISAVREAMASVLDEDSELDLNAIAPAENFFINSNTGAAATQPAAQPVTPTAVQPAAGPPDSPVPVDSPPPDSPAPPPVAAVPPARIPAPRRALPNAITSGEKTRRVRLPSRGPKLPPTVKSQSSAGSISVIVLLLVVMFVLGIVFLASLIDSIGSTFD
jgi:hypothetical protein